jgi:hypothetical protein
VSSNFEKRGKEGAAVAGGNWSQIKRQQKIMGLLHFIPSTRQVYTSPPGTPSAPPPLHNPLLRKISSLYSTEKINFKRKWKQTKRKITEKRKGQFSLDNLEQIRAQTSFRFSAKLAHPTYKVEGLGTREGRGGKILIPRDVNV